ncbi:MAG: hypothetical protein Q9202_003964 [Teloschistes flavicans]
MNSPMNVEKSISTFSAAVEDEESDWEYEYDETATESFYVTIDCSSNSHRTRVPRKPKTPPNDATSAPAEQHQEGQQDEDDEESERDGSPTKQSRQKKATSQENLAIDPALLDENAEVDGSPSPSSPTIRTDTPPPPPSDPATRIQILDLHTSNPLIAYNSQLHTCTWASTIGTDIFLASPSALPSLPNTTTPLQSFPNVSILSTSCIKLTARPLTVAPKIVEEPQPAPGAASDDPTTTTTTTTKATDARKIPLAPTAKIQQRNQASFLERLIAIKAAKGEPDDVTVFSRTANQGTGWRARRRAPGRAESLDHDNEARPNDQEPTVRKSPAPPPSPPLPPLPPPHSTLTTDTTVRDPQQWRTPSSATDAPPAKRARGRGAGRPRTRGRIGRPRGSRGSRSRGVVGLFKGVVVGVEGGGVGGAGMRGARTGATGMERGTATTTPVRWEDIVDVGMRDGGGGGGGERDGAVGDDGGGGEGGDGDVRMEDA